MIFRLPESPNATTLTAQKILCLEEQPVEDEYFTEFLAQNQYNFIKCIFRPGKSGSFTQYECEDFYGRKIIVSLFYFSDDCDGSEEDCKSMKALIGKYIYFRSKLGRNFDLSLLEKNTMYRSNLYKFYFENPTPGFSLSATRYKNNKLYILKELVDNTNKEIFDKEKIKYDQERSELQSPDPLPDSDEFFYDIKELIDNTNKKTYNKKKTKYDQERSELQSPDPLSDSDEFFYDIKEIIDNKNKKICNKEKTKYDQERSESRSPNPLSDSEESFYDSTDEESYNDNYEYYSESYEESSQSSYYE